MLDMFTLKTVLKSACLFQHFIKTLLQQRPHWELTDTHTHTHTHTDSFPVVRSASIGSYFLFHMNRLLDCHDGD